MGKIELYNRLYNCGIVSVGDLENREMKVKNIDLFNRSKRLGIRYYALVYNLTWDFENRGMKVREKYICMR